MRRLTRLLVAFGCLLALCAHSARAFDEDHKEAINGTTLHFRVRGADKAHPYLLILHGGPGFSAHMFYPWGPSLEKTVNVVYLDQRGSGESAHLPVADPQNVQPAEVKGYTISALVADIEGVRRSLRVDRWYVLGHSWGGMLGLDYVAAHPDHVLGYIHMDGLVSVPAMETGMLDAAQAKFQAKAGQSGTAGDEQILAEVRRLRAQPPSDPARLEGLFGLAMGPAGLYFAKDPQTAFLTFNRKIATAVQPYGIPYASLMPTEAPAVGLMVNDHYLSRDETPLLAKIAVPTLVINGKQDGVITPQEAEATHAGIKNSQIVLLDDCGHFPFAEQPAATSAAVIAFIRAQKPAAVPVTQATDAASVTAPCVVEFFIDAQGDAEQIRVKHSSGSESFDAACVQAVRGSHPRSGQSIPRHVEYTFHAG